MIPVPYLVVGGAAAIVATKLALDKRRATIAAKKLQDPAQLSAVVDKLPASSVSPTTSAAISSLQVGLPPGQGIASPQLEQQLADKLQAAQAVALASPSLANNAAVIQAAVDNAAFTAAEDSSNPSGSGPIAQGTADPAFTGDRRLRIHAPHFAARYRAAGKFHGGAMHPRTMGTFVRRGV